MLYKYFSYDCIWSVQSATGLEAGSGCYWKETLSKDINWPEKRKKEDEHYLLICRFWINQSLYHESIFSAINMSFLSAKLCWFTPNPWGVGKGWLMHNIPFSKHARLVCDVTGTDCPTQIGSNHCNVFVIFKSQFLTAFYMLFLITFWRNWSQTTRSPQSTL